MQLLFVSITKVGRTYATLLKRMGLMVSLVWMMLISVAFANVPTIAVEELRPGMTGYGKTVFQGTKIETFDVEVLGVTGSETGGYSILIRASGDNLRKMAVFPKA